MEKLRKFIFIQDWRTVDKIKYFRKIVNDTMRLVIENDEDFLNQISDEFSECLYLDNIEELIDEKSDSILNENYKKFRMSQMKIFLATYNEKFLTNDNQILYIDSKKVEYGIYYPISPSVILGFVRGDCNKIKIEQMPANSIREINKTIKREAKKFYISCEKMR